ncbi:MAG: hypothetical protein QNJ51_14760 [Calothrix sp. MO_167.B12]|nr:hypothetical protein [Calothrix sp. MO_167.B12]
MLVAPEYGVLIVTSPESPEGMGGNPNDPKEFSPVQIPTLLEELSSKPLLHLFPPVQNG